MRRRNSDSSAQLVFRDLRHRLGIAREDVCAEHISDLIGGLKRLFPPPRENFESEVFRGLCAADTSGAEPVWGVIVETRRHPALETVVLNVVANCGIPVQVFHSPENADYIKSTEISDLVEKGQVILTALNLPAKINQRIYNQLMLSARFWQQMKGRNKILVFQTDSMCCPASALSIADFMHFDYIGSNWGQSRPVGLLINGGCGGFSLRDWSSSVTCLDRFPPETWPGGEDGYFAFHLELMGANVASLEEAGRFATQDWFEHSSFACHQIGRLKDADLAAFLSYCPEARGVFGGFDKRLSAGKVNTLPSVPALEPDGSGQSLLPGKDRDPVHYTVYGIPMFISHKYNLIYYEVPRTGSNSVTRALSAMDPESPTLEERKERGGGWAYHYLNKATRKILDDPSYRLVAAHRNPYDRLWSFWKHRKLSGNPKSFKSISWARYIDWVCVPSAVPELSGAMVDRPVSELIETERVDFWLDFHRLESSWNQLARELDLPLPPLKKLNKSADYGDMHDAYNEDKAGRVAQRFAVDFDFFGYPIDSWRPGERLECAKS